MSQSNFHPVINVLLVTKERDIPYITLESDYQTDGSDTILEMIMTMINTAFITNTVIPIQGVEYSKPGSRITAATMWIEIEELADLPAAQAWLLEIGHQWSDENDYNMGKQRSGQAYWGYKMFRS